MRVGDFRESGVVVEQLPRHRRVLLGLEVAGLVGLRGELGAAQAQVRHQVFGLNP